MKIGNLVKVYLNNHDEPASPAIDSETTRETLGTIVRVLDGVTNPTYEKFEVLVEGKLVWFYEDEVHPPQKNF